MHVSPWIKVFPQDLSDCFGGSHYETNGIFSREFREVSQKEIKGARKNRSIGPGKS
jgi:hypothetical protein